MTRSSAATPESHEYSTVVFSTRSEVDSLASDWERLQWHPNADHGFFRLIARMRPEVVGEYVVAVKRDDQVVSLAACRVENSRYDIRFGYRTLLKPRVRQLVVVHGGIMGEASEAVSRHLSLGLRRSLATHQVDLIALHGLRGDSPFQSVLRHNASWHRDRFPVNQAHWQITLPRSSEDLFSNVSAKHRHELRRMWRSLERSYPGNVTVKVFEARREVRDFIVYAGDVAAQSYLRAMQCGFVPDDESKARLDFWADRGNFLAYVLFVGGRPCSFWQGTVYRDTYYLDTTAFAPDFSKFEVGTQLLARCLEDLCRRFPHVRFVDFGLGDALYKRKFGTHSWVDTTSCLFAPTLKGLCTRVVRDPIVATERLTRLFLQKVGWEQRAKTWLKRRARN